MRETSYEIQSLVELFVMLARRAKDGTPVEARRAQAQLEGLEQALEEAHVDLDVFRSAPRWLQEQLLLAAFSREDARESFLAMATSPEPGGIAAAAVGGILADANETPLDGDSDVDARVSTFKARYFERLERLGLGEDTAARVSVLVEKGPLSLAHHDVLCAALLWEERLDVRSAALGVYERIPAPSEGVLSTLTAIAEGEEGFAASDAERLSAARALVTFAQAFPGRAAEIVARLAQTAASAGPTLREALGKLALAQAPNA